MGKQTMGVPFHSLSYRSDNKIYKLQTPETPMVRPVKYDTYEMDHYPLGTNAVVAVVSYTVSGILKHGRALRAVNINVLTFSQGGL